jgi:hypothetical protein
MCDGSKPCTIDKTKIFPTSALYTGNAGVTHRSGLMCTDKTMIQTTDRLRLVAGTKVLAASEIEDREEFAELLGVIVPETWPPDNLRDVLGYLYGLYKEHPE